MYKAREWNKAKNGHELQADNHGICNYLHRLNFYDRPPLYDVTIEEFETCALDRLRILAEIEASAARNRTWDELKSFINAMCRKYIPLGYNGPKQDDRHIRNAERRKDHLGHFVLRLAFCRSEDLRRRFVKAESTLFKIRYETETAEHRAEFLRTRDFNWLPVDSEEKRERANDLVALHFAGPESEGEKIEQLGHAKFYKVRWTRVPDLVEKRAVLLKGGWAYVPEAEQASIVFQEFETHLERAMEVTARALPRLDEDTRLLPILDNLSKGFIAGVASEWNNASNNNGEIKAEMVDDLARHHFPMCMRTLHESLRQDCHLKHFGRLQYGLFLKVLGLTIEEAIAFWRKAFNKTTDDKFNKEYKYNIRHSYGLEGKRANYPAKSPSEPGCPYRQFTRENLSTALLQLYASQGLRSADIPEIMATVKGGHYHVACTRVFELTHAARGVKRGDGVGDGESVTHPNQYAARSIEIERGGGEPRIVLFIVRTRGDENVAKLRTLSSSSSTTTMSMRKASSASPAPDQQPLQQYQDTDGHFSLVRNFRLADLVTIMNGVCGSFSIFSSARYLATHDLDYLWTALSFPLAGLMFDFLDGKVARWRKSSSLLGQELDSLADLISFGVAPALLAFVVGLRTYLDTVVLTGFICCGLARLARFNATVALVPKKNSGKAKYFEGLPIPSSLILVGILSYWTKKGWIEDGEGIPWGTVTLWGETGGRGEMHWVCVLFGGWAAAMVSKTLRVPKL
ncbi:hypothetical protein AX17_003455 [Amanita inopinata Kibby_2008]|nr:hypothetical protein AX17_003455 [Amanita inopinata Kibby_2008]